jgi:hypothetical protein
MYSKIYGVVISEYQFESLAKGDILTHIQKTVNRHLLLDRLRMFKDKCHKNEQSLTSNFIKTTGL